MGLVRRLAVLSVLGTFFFVVPAFSPAQVTNTPTNSPTVTDTRTPSFTHTFTGTSTPTGTPTNSHTPTDSRTPTSTHTFTDTQTQTGTPTNSFTPTSTFTPNPALTPPCGASASTFGVTTGASSSCCGSYTMRASMFTLDFPATVYSLWLESSNAGNQVMAGIYSGSVGSIGTTIVSSNPQTVMNGWNGIPIPPTYLSAPATYWLAYAYAYSSGVTVWTTTSAAVPNAFAYTDGSVPFGTMPKAMPATITYDSASPYISDAIYAVYCKAPTDTPTPSDTPTSTETTTGTFTPTATGSPDTPTPSFTPTSSFTPTPSFTPTDSPSFTPSATPNQSLTPDCGAAATFFGETNFAGAAQTAISEEAFRACRYTLSQSGTVETMSLHLPNQDAGLFVITTAIYSNGASTVVGNLLTQAVTYQVSTGGWNVFQVTPTFLTAGDYWLAYMYSGSSTDTFALNYQSVPAPTGGNTACNFGPPPFLAGFTFPTDGSFVPAGNYVTIGFYEPIIANFCPGTGNTPTPTSSPTITFTPTLSPTPTLTGTPTISFTPTLSPTSTWTGTPSFSPTLTDSPTPTLSPTDSMTPTVTSTSTPTGTPTNTLTVTDTPTLTDTYTNTFSQTPTSTPSNTVTSTPTSTFTNSLTATASATATSTPTLTPTGTLSPVATSTPSFTSTDSPTPSATDSMTATPTLTPTASLTATATSTGTATSIATSTGTSTLTATATASPSSTPSFTPTPSPSATPTGTPDAEIAKTVSESTANPGDTLTYTLTLNVTGGPVSGVSVSDVLPGSLNFVGFGPILSGGVTMSATTSWIPSTRALGWGFGSALAPGVYTITYQAQVSSNPQASVITNNAQMTYNGVTAPKTSSVNITLASATPLIYPNPLKGPGPVNLEVALSKPQDSLCVKVFTTAFRKVYEDTVLSVPGGVFLYGLDPGRFKGAAGANGLYYVVITTPSDRWVLKLLVTR